MTLAPLAALAIGLVVLAYFVFRQDTTPPAEDTHTRW